MATTKTSSTKRKTTPAKATTAKRTTSKKTPTKRTSTKSAATKKPTTKRPATKSTVKRSKNTKAASAKSFKLEQSNEPFVSLKVTVQTLYWLILAGAVLLLGLWVLDISQKVQTIYDQIDSNMIIQSELDQRELEILREKNAKNN